MIVYNVGGKQGHSCAGANHITKVFVKKTFAVCDLRLCDLGSWAHTVLALYTKHY